MNSFINKFIDLFFREKNICFICDSYEKVKNNLCCSCSEKLVYVGYNRCGICGKKLNKSDDKITYCLDCQKYSKSFVKGTSSIVYSGIGKEVIDQFKYRDKAYLKKLLGKLLTKEIIESGLDFVDIIIPIPISNKKENRRGYNQVELIAEIISNDLRIPLETKVLKKEIETKPQNKLKRIQRRVNLKDSFAIAENIKIENKTILLIDDVYTTGATINECSKLLIEKGAKEVYFGTIATSYEE